MNKPVITLATAAVLGVAAMLHAGSADAQRSNKQASKQERPGSLSREESAAISPVVQAVQAEDWATASAGLLAAQAAAQSPYARFVIGQLQLAIGRGTQNTQLQAQGVDAMVASGGAPAESLPALLGVQADFAIQAQNWAAAEAPLTRLLDSDPNNVQRITTLAQIKLRLNRGEEARALFRRALEIATAGGQTAPEDLYRRQFAMAYEAGQMAEALDASRQLLRAYPNATNWRDALMVYRQLGRVDGQLDLDSRRLMRVTGALESEADYVEYADQLNRAGLPAEVKAVLDDGVARGKLRPGGPHVDLLNRANGAVAEDRAGLAGQRAAALASPQARSALGLADAYASHGQYAEAVELYRAALGKTGADTNLINTRLGAALALAGQRAEAEAIFRSITGPRADLAAFWLLWLERRPG
jgi:tetratricopeptide (TPR) repeat protein